MTCDEWIELPGGGVRPARLTPCYLVVLDADLRERRYYTGKPPPIGVVGSRDEVHRNNEHTDLPLVLSCDVIASPAVRERLTETVAMLADARAERTERRRRRVAADLRRRAVVRAARDRTGATAPADLLDAAAALRAVEALPADGPLGQWSP